MTLTDKNAIKGSTSIKGEQSDRITSLSAIEDEKVLSELLALAQNEDFGDAADSGSAPADFIKLLEQFVRFGTGEQFIWDYPEELFLRVKRVWAETATRKIGEPLIRFQLVSSITTPGASGEKSKKRLMLCICTDDKPFLVDSVTAALTDAGKSITFFANTILEGKRNQRGERDVAGSHVRESVIYAELDLPINNSETTDLEAALTEVLTEVDAAVCDWQSMRERMMNAIAGIERLHESEAELSEKTNLQEVSAFLKWLHEAHFSFLGVRRYLCEKVNGNILFTHVPEQDLGILKNPSRRILKNTYVEGGELSEAVATFLKSDEPILLAKANSKSLVHRRVYQDYIGVKLYDDHGNMIGEDRFIGLYTADAYNMPASDIPLLREKVSAVLERAPFVDGSHNQKALINILETYPRDELFQTDVDTIAESSFEILRLYKRPRVKLIMRRDRFNRFVSAFVYVPRDQFNSDRREAIGKLLATAFEGRVSAFYPFFGDAALVRVHFIIGLNPGAPQGPGIASLTDDIRKICRDWEDDLLEQIRVAHDGVAPRGLFERYHKAFELGYKDHIPTSEALGDIAEIDGFGDQEVIIRAYNRAEDRKNGFRVKIFKKIAPLQLSEIIPTLENFDLKVISEDTYEVNPAPEENSDGCEKFWIQDFHVEAKAKQKLDISLFKTEFEQALTAILLGQCENDGFNALVVAVGLNWREAWLLRACAKYHLQAGFSFSQNYLEETLRIHPHITRLLIQVFHARFRPDNRDRSERDEHANGFVKTIYLALDEVTSLDEDRIIRRFLNLLMVLVRTNYYQIDYSGNYKSAIALKIDAQELEELPSPKPYKEIFVSGPMVDGVHLRFGPIARGGLRWSDRKEDFRTEILGLVKAQRVKNAVIVPTGSKGGFYPKQIPSEKSKAVQFEAGRAAYKLYINALLDVTDNIVKGGIVAPEGVFCFDEVDPYLVVAADKGTATFSDTANEISLERDFWLGDAFASGGSVGYDHKVMGITARGGWEAVKRHFREKGKDIQSEPFSVAGVGDMSGDVFGNGMLLSKHIRLIAAFDHRDIFIDPDPDVKASYEERKRLFELGPSSWQDYDKDYISKGGGVFSRKSKSITLTPQIKEALGTVAETLTPNELIKTILKNPVELFWLGGIGTYFKAVGEEDWKVGDRANDNIRINSDEMRMQVIGEGANLGLTQKARIAFAEKGGAINTDAIDNSAGVDSSDHEVNIKILLREAIERKILPEAKRNDLLSSMTEDVALYVLRHNYEQTRALSQLATTAEADLDGQSRFLVAMEEEGRIDREVEDLPSHEAIEIMKEQGRGLSRPELAVLMAYAKLWLIDALVDSKLPDDEMLHHELVEYFPAALHEFKVAIENHRLRREIIATRMANEIVDTCGISFVHEAITVTGASAEEICICYEAARQIYDLRDFSQMIKQLDNIAPARTQNDLYFEAATLLKEQTYRLVTDIEVLNKLATGGLESVIALYKDQVMDIRKSFKEIAPPDAADTVERRKQKWIKRGAPEAVAKEAALFPSLERAFDVVDISNATGWDNQSAGSVFFALGRQLKLDIVREFLRNQPPLENFDKRATRRLMEEITRQQKTLTLNVIDMKSNDPNSKDGKWLNDIITNWRERYEFEIIRYHKFADDIDLAGQSPSVSKLSLLALQLAELNERMTTA